MKFSILFFLVCFSGTIAVFSHELDWVFNPEMRAKPSDTYASRNDMVDSIHSYFPEGKIGYWMRSREPYLTDIVYVNVEGQNYYTFVNQYTGKVQGAATLTIQRFFRDFHYYLFIPGQWGNFIVLFFAFVLVIALATAILYYKDWYKKLFDLKIGKGSRAFYGSLHKVVGSWSIPFMLIIGVTGLWYFVERADFPKISHHMDEQSPEVDSSYFSNGKIKAEDIDLDRCIALAKAEIPGLEVKTILLPSHPGRPLYLTGTSDVPLVRYRANRVYINPYTYKVMKVQRAEEINTVTWINDIADPLHFGYWGGLVTKFIWFIFGLGLSSLILTGPWLYLKRRVKIHRHKKERRLAYG